MKALKTIAIIFVAILVVMALLLGYLFLSAEVTIDVIGSQSMVASTVPSFNALKDSIDEKTFIGTVYNVPATWLDSSEYAYITYQVSVNNGCLVPIEMIEVQVVPQPTDVVQLGNMQEYSLAPKTSGEVSASVLSHSIRASARELIVSYYVWGVSFQQRIVAN